MIKAVIFDLDGVIVSTDKLHFKGWKAIAGHEGIPFTKADNDRLRGVSRMESLDILLEKAGRVYGHEEKQQLAAEKNNIYTTLLDELTPSDILPGVTAALQWVKARHILTAIGSSSRNTPKILERIGLTGAFDAVADGNQITNSKPDPEVFLLAARLLDVSPGQCLVVEDAHAGVEAAKAAGMKVLAVGAAGDSSIADYCAADLQKINWNGLIQPGSSR